jgi:hypothetical protein
LTGTKIKIVPPKIGLAVRAIEQSSRTCQSAVVSGVLKGPVTAVDESDELLNLRAAVAGTIMIILEDVSGLPLAQVT